mmetsp:Transcript_19714/g.64098  ORF Transcript_19714/g.64098 Transcript_19714/m.64098 type:complete len:163 (+) Transcript_19714:223-711(+)
MCWEHAGKLAEVKPKLDDAGVLLAVLGIGTSESAKEFAERVGLAADSLFADEERAVYKHFSLHGDLDGTEGIFFDPKVVDGVKRLFFNKTTGERIKERGTDGLKAAMQVYKPLMPKDSKDTVQQGGMLVMKGKEVLYFHKDEATFDHAPLDDVLSIALAAAA